jgi:hypothetical protein
MESKCPSNYPGATMVAPTAEWAVRSEARTKSKSGESRLSDFALHDCQDAVTISAFCTFLHRLQPPPSSITLTIHSTKMAAIDPSLSSEPANTNANQQIPPITQAVAQGSPMQTLQPQHPDHYRALPPPQQMYAPPYQPHQQMQYPPPQPAPRQRTAIACRYCRRRKVCAKLTFQTRDRIANVALRFAAQASTSRRMAGAPTASASHKSVSSLRSVAKRKRSSRRTPSGVAKVLRRSSCMARTGSRFHNTAIAIPTHHHSNPLGSIHHLRKATLSSLPCINNRLHKVVLAKSDQATSHTLRRFRHQILVRRRRSLVMDSSTVIQILLV